MGRKPSNKQTNKQTIYSVYYGTTIFWFLGSCFVGIRIKLGLQYPFFNVKGDKMERSFTRDRKKRGSMSQQVWHDKDPSLFSSARQRSIYFATLYRQWCRLHSNETSLARYKTTENGQPVPYKCASLKIVFKSSLILPNCVGKPKWSGTIFLTNRKRVSMFCNIHVTEIITQSSLTCNNKVS